MIKKIKRIIILLIVFFIVHSCFNGYFNKQKITFIFDFDDTIYCSDKKGGYPYFLGLSFFGEKKMQSLYGNIDDFIKKEKKMQSKNNIFSILQKIMLRYKIIPAEKDVRYVIDEIKKRQTKGLPEVLKYLKSQGHQVLIIGGGFFGCAIIPDVVKDYGIKKKDIYSGYFKDYKEHNIIELLNSEYTYANCGDIDLKKNIFKKKSQLISFLKNNGTIKGKVVHIGDGSNDLETWNAKEVDLFIGFGLNKIEKEVKNKAPVFVDNIEDFEIELKKAIKKYSYKYSYI